MRVCEREPLKSVISIMETKMDDMKLVVKELNSRLGKKLNVISYDNLRGE